MQEEASANAQRMGRPTIRHRGIMEIDAVDGCGQELHNRSYAGLGKIHRRAHGRVEDGDRNIEVIADEPGKPADNTDDGTKHAPRRRGIVANKEAPITVMSFFWWDQ
jgi:hypothetical protein